MDKKILPLFFTIAMLLAFAQTVFSDSAKIAVSPKAVVLGDQLVISYAGTPNYFITKDTTANQTIEQSITPTGSPQAHTITSADYSKKKLYSITAVYANAPSETAYFQVIGQTSISPLIIPEISPLILPILLAAMVLILRKKSGKKIN